MNFIYIILLLHVVRSSYADENETEDKVGIEAEVKSASPGDEIEHIEPEMAVRDALAESELVKSANPGDGYLSSDLRSDASDAASPLDSSERTADNDDNTSRSAQESESSIVPGVVPRGGSINTEEAAVRSADDLKIAETSPSVIDDSLRTAKDDESVTADVVSVRSATPEDLTLSTRRMPDHNILDTKARSGNLNAPMPQAQTFKPLDFPAFAQLNATFLTKPVFKPFLPIPPHIPYPPLPPFDPKPLLLDNNELTNQYKRFSNYPAMERFQSYQVPPIPSTFAPIEKSYNNLFLKATDVPPLLFNQNIHPRPFFTTTFGNPNAQPKYFLPNFNFPQINT